MGSDGHHFAVLTGPGRIWLQSMPLPILAGVIGEYMPDRDDHHGAEGVAAGVGARQGPRRHVQVVGRQAGSASRRLIRRG